MSFIARSENLVRASGLTSSLYPAVVFILGALMATGPAVSFAQLGRAKLTHESQVGSTLSKPKVIYVTDFALDSTQLPSSGSLQEKIQEGGPLRQRLKALQGGDNSSQDRTQSLINLMADSIVQNLQAKGLNAQRASIRTVPTTGWIVKGRYKTVQQGHRVASSEVGFGAGSPAGTS